MFFVKTTKDRLEEVQEYLDNHQVTCEIRENKSFIFVMVVPNIENKSSHDDYELAEKEFSINFSKTGFKCPMCMGKEFVNCTHPIYQV